MHERRDRQIVVGRSVKVLPEDVPEAVTQALPGIAYRTELNLSPIEAPEAARKFLSRSAAAIAKAIHGVVFDPQADQVTLPSGIKRFAKPGVSESASVISMSWWFIEGPAARGEFGPLLDILKVELPEGLPRRYGSFEPPEHVFAETGPEHFSLSYPNISKVRSSFGIRRHRCRTCTSVFRRLRVRPSVASAPRTSRLMSTPKY
jgi:hypothetical protein